MQEVQEPPQLLRLAVQHELIHRGAAEERVVGLVHGVVALAVGRLLIFNDMKIDYWAPLQNLPSSGLAT